MNQLRSVGIFLIVCAAICGLVGFERYTTAQNTAMAVAETLEGVEFVAVAVPLPTKIAGFLGVVLLVSGIRCLLESRREKSA